MQCTDTRQEVHSECTLGVNVEKVRAMHGQYSVSTQGAQRQHIGNRRTVHSLYDRPYTKNHRKCTGSIQDVYSQYEVSMHTSYVVQIYTGSIHTLQQEVHQQYTPVW